jgi:serine/threonine-protein kinase PpkA
MNRDPSISGQNPALPDIFGYRLQRVLGYGGMSTVYLARQISLDREVALKVMLPEALTDEISRRRFENEARTIARLDHPNIVGIFEVGRTRDGLPYYAMPYLARGHVGQRAFTADPAQARSILDALLSALEYAHSRGVVHRDVKAENVLFDDADRPLLADFGIALRRGYGTRVTTAGLAVGSTAYMPPEQARGHNVDGRADVYSVGVLGWEMLTGRLPYNAGDALSMALQHAQEPIPRLPPELRHWQKFFDRALAKTPEARFASAKDMRAALAKVPEHAHGVSNDTHRWLPWAGAAAVLLAFAAGFMAWPWGSRERDAAGSSAPAAGSTPPASGAAAQQGTQALAVDGLDTLKRPLPESATERWLVAAATQIEQERWTTPQGDNAYESLMTAAQADPTHPRLAPVAGELIAALARQAVRTLGRGETAPAVEAMTRARALSERIALPRTSGATRPQALLRMESQVTDALQARVDEAVKKGDRDAVVGIVADARKLGLDPSRLRGTTIAIAAQAGPVAAQPMPRERGWTLLRTRTGSVAIAEANVSRGDYARFAEVSRREPARCRERGSLLRILAPRDWTSPGFEQTPQQPVVCVSWQDAQAYARWLGARDGRRYRLASADELRAAPAAGSGAIGSWSDACGETCAQRLAIGDGAREKAERRLQPERGYDDVGFRLARDL